MPFISNAYLDYLSPNKREGIARTHTPLGYQPETNDTLYIPHADRYAGMYILGVQGSGKSGLLQNLIIADIAAGRAVIVMDPHGDLVMNCLRAMEATRLPHAYLLDMEDEAFPFGVNVFTTPAAATSLAQTQAVERILHVFTVLWPEVLSQQNLPRYLRAATLTFLANPGSTLVDMHAFLLDSAVRRRMLKNVTDPTVLQFWQSHYDDLSEAERMRRVQPLMNRLESLFMGRSLVRNLVGQRKTTIDFRQAIEQGETLFIKLPLKTVKQDAQLIGTLLLAQIHAAIFSFADLPADKRPGVSLFIDEFQNFATEDIAELFTEGRKFGTRLVVAHQFRSQLSSTLRDATMTARSMVCFHLAPDDARDMAPVFLAQEGTIQPGDINAHPVEYLLTYGLDNSFVQTFIETYLRPLHSHKRGNRVEIETRHLAPSIAEVWSGGRMPNPRLADPTAYLDSLLYQVMKTGDAFLPIPPDAVKGFASCGRGFYKQSIGLGSRDPLLLASARFPPALVVATATGGLRWTRRPEGGTEQLFHFIFHLRMVMMVLAEEPIGRKTSLSPADVAKMLVRLPKRAAFVRSGETVGVIYTHDTPQQPAHTMLSERITYVLEHTQVVYCHPKAEAEQAFTQPQVDAPESGKPHTPNDDEPPFLSRWEEL